MKIKTVIGSTMALGLLGIGVLAGSVVGAGQAAAQTPVASPTAVATAAPSQPALPSQPAKPAQPTTSTVTQAAAEQTALAASPGSTVDHSALVTQNGIAVWDVDFANGGGVIVNAETGAVITVEAALTDTGGGKGGRGGHGGGAGNQAALLAQAKVTQADAEKTALAASPGSTIDHSRLDNRTGTLLWDIDFTDGGGVTVDAQTGAVIATEAAGTDTGGHGFKHDPSQTAPSTSATPTP